MITDTHTHLYSEQFDEDRESVIERAKKLGVSRFFIPAIDSSYMDRMLDLEKNYSNSIFLMMGLHPTSVKENYKALSDWHVIQVDSEESNLEIILPNGISQKIGDFIEDRGVDFFPTVILYGLGETEETFRMDSYLTN